jgi:Fe-Mn family superoxide dismutase
LTDITIGLLSIRFVINKIFGEFMAHELPPLDYAYDALEPHIDEQTMRLHHDIHHQGYVTGLNNAEAKLAEARESNNFALVKHWERELAFHGAGHFLHCIFWKNMGPNGGGKPTGALLSAIEKSFGSYDSFQAQFKAAAAAVEGSGWALLVKNHVTGQLEILTAEKHQNLTQWVTEPLLVIDVWEHAYYLKYQNKRAAYIDGFLNVINWKDVAARFEGCCKTK